MDPKIIRDGYGKLFYVYSEDEWNNNGKVTMDWGNWEPLAFSSKPTNKEKEIENNDTVITEGVIQEVFSLIEELNALILNANQSERERLYRLIESIAYAMRDYIQVDSDNEE